MKFKNVINKEHERVDSKTAWKELYDSGKLGQQIKNMSVNSITQPILNKINDFIKEHGYMNAEVARDLLTAAEKKYLAKIKFDY